MKHIKKLEFNYSLKDIPLSNRKEYKIKLYDAASKFINRLRWKAFFISNESVDINKQKEEDIFKTNRSAPACEEIKKFEVDLFKLSGSIKFTNHRSRFTKP